MIRDYADVQDYLCRLKRRGVQPGLDRIQAFTTALGHPERATPCIHVAGTNGKGSVAAMLEAILRTAGWRTGLYTSPHLVQLAERIQVNRRMIPPDQLVSQVQQLQPVAEALAPDMRPSYFEFMTALAFRHFAHERCDIAIIEAGMGGWRDATNVVIPELSVITSIGLDHCEFLGDTVEKIAGEKAGIIKTGRPVVIGLLPAAAEAVVRASAATRAAPLVSVAEWLATNAGARPGTNLEGEHQRVNAATAMLAAKTLSRRWRLTEDGITRALGQVEWPGRWQRIQTGPRTVILDAAHNADAAPSLERNLAALTSRMGRKPVVVVGVLGAARARPLLDVLCRQAGEIHLVVPLQSRACSHAELEALAPAGCRARLKRASIEALFPAPGTCAAGGDNDTVVVTGSIYLVGEVLSRLDPSRGSFEAHLQDF